tara:strand:- start:1237 stop:1554 length:318 start_codon:yes stop_codon:yes gene_type:complete
MFGFNFGGVFGYKRECSKKGYRQTKDGPLMGEVEAISGNCNSTYGGIPTYAVDALLATGGKIISVTDVRKNVDIFEEDGDVQPGNTCVGKEYVIEAKKSVFEKNL